MRDRRWSAVEKRSTDTVRSALRQVTASVRARTTIGATVVLAVGGLIGSIVVVLLLQRALIDTVQTDAETRSGTVARIVATSDLTTVRRELETNTAESQLVQVVAPDGAIIVSSSARAGERLLSTLRPADGVVESERRDTLDFLHTDDTYVVTARGVEKGGEAYTVVVAASIAPQTRSVEQLVAYLSILLPIGLVLVAGGVWALVGRALRPVEAIRSRVARIRAGRLTDRVPVPAAHDEVARLATTMNEMLDRLETGQRAQRSFVSDASHELRSPLATLAASIEVMGDEPTDDRWRETRTVMSAEVGRMARLVDGLLLLAKVDDQGLATASEDVDLDDIMGDEVRRLRHRDDLSVEAHITPVRVSGDRARLAQVVRNLVENAAAASRGRLRVSVDADATTAFLAVDDDGAGIAVGDRDRVFERFVRLDSSRSRDSGGSGLGLAIVKEIVAAHGGRVDIGDSVLGGARVEVRLPITRS